MLGASGAPAAAANAAHALAAANDSDSWWASHALLPEPQPCIDAAPAPAFPLLVLALTEPLTLPLLPPALLPPNPPKPRASGCRAKGEAEQSVPPSHDGLVVVVMVAAAAAACCCGGWRPSTDT